MADIYVTGHRNPDMDSICSAYAYAFLKNLIDSENRYIPARLGSVNKNIKNLFQRLHLSLPVVLKDIKPKVKEVTKLPKYSIQLNDPVYELLNIFAEHKPSVIPAFDENGEYVDLLDSDDINTFFLQENNGVRREYTIREENIEKIIPGHFVKRSDREVIKCPLMVCSMEYAQFKKRLLKSTTMPILVTGLREHHIKRALSSEIPGLVITGIEDEKALEVFDFDSFDGFVFLSEVDTAETLRYLRLSTPVSELLVEGECAKCVDSDSLFDDVKEDLMNSGERGFSVVENGKWIGFVTRRCFLNKPKQKVILVDHNESEQSVIGIEDGEIVEIIDHHRLAPPRMKTPIYICSEPLGSTCTIVYEQFKKYGLKPDKKRATILLSGLMSDTVILKSPTTTEYDKHVAQKLAQRAGVEDIQEYCQVLFSANSSLSGQDPVKVIEGDLKKYFEYGVKFAIGQVEVTNLAELDSLNGIYINALKHERDALALDWCMLLVTDVINDTSVLFSTGHVKENRFVWEKLDDNLYDLPGVLSRKKQLLPEILRILED